MSREAMIPLLSRYAECIFWTARYMERAENLARIIDVTQNFARERVGSRNWLPVVQINAEEKRFLAKHAEPTAQAVTHFFLLDPDNPTSVLASVQAARENARTLRPLISTEMWSQINVFHLWLKALTAADIGGANLSRLCAGIKERCQTHTGITEGTFYRDQGWYFYQLGKYIERGDQTTRLLDIKYHTLLPRVADVGSPLDVSQWNVVLRAAAGYHAFRRVYPRGMSPDAVAGFLLFNDSFPRSVILCVRLVEWFLTQLRSRYGLRDGADALEGLDELRAALADRTIEDVLARGLHEYLDWVQQQLIAVTGRVGRAFFGYEAQAG